VEAGIPNLAVCAGGIFGGNVVAEFAHEDTTVN